MGVHGDPDGHPLIVIDERSLLPLVDFRYVTRAWPVTVLEGEILQDRECNLGERNYRSDHVKPAEKYEHRAKPGKKKKSKKKAELCEGLVSLANQLDTQGFDRLADHVTELLKIALKK